MQVMPFRDDSAYKIERNSITHGLWEVMAYEGCLSFTSPLFYQSMDSRTIHCYAIHLTAFGELPYTQSYW